MSRASDDQAPDGALTRAQALAEPSRARIHRLITAADHPLTIADLAASTGLHRTAVGTHLTRLVEAGLAERTVTAPAGRGRPVTVFRAVEHDPYRALAEWLAEGVRTGTTARELGHAIGERMADHGADPVETLTREASRLGFAPELRSRRTPDSFDLVLHSCPFADLASIDPDTVCELHLGLAEGLTIRAADVEVHSLHRADPHRGGCRLTFTRTTA